MGEHGHRTIPVYNSEEKYDEASSKVGFFLADIGKLAGVKRNLATAPLMANLIRSVTEDRGDVHYISGYSPQRDLSHMATSNRAERNTVRLAVRSTS